VANAGDNTVSVLLGNGDGSFQAARAFGVGISPLSVAVGDFNGDGAADLVVADGYFLSDSVYVLLGNGNGSFQAPRNYTVGIGPVSVTVGDFLGNGALDLAVANAGSDSVSVLLGNGDGSFQAASNFSAGSFPASVAVGDFNGDGIPDLVTANFRSQDVSVLLGNGDGSYQASQNFRVANVSVSVAGGGFNGDGWPDVVVANAGSNKVSILLNDCTWRGR
jgi:hypothetical protein